ncbi:MAG: fused MFS/spermidine synthase [Myxococcota bacterium]|nr:fused MFS/spermidine synthase [Myxococcota bacterium]
MKERKYLFVYFLFVASGATSLVYEVTWFRNLSLTFGASFQATSIVLASFMAGLSLGGYILGRKASRMRRPLQVYGWLEIGVGAFALCLPTLLGAVDSLYLSAVIGQDRVGALLPFLRTSMAFIILVIPTFLMGGTLPVITRLLVRQDDQFGVRLSWLYGSNTLGAVVGTLLAGFILIPTIGVWNSQLAAVAFNLAIGILALLIDRQLEPLQTEEEEEESAEPSLPVLPEERPILTLVFWGTAVSGFASLSLEVLWTRGISLAVGSSTYSFSIMLAAFLIGIGLGSWLHALVPLRRISLGVQFGIVTFFAGAFSLLTSWWIPRLPQLAIQLNLFLYDDLTRIRPATTLLLAFTVMLLPCVLIGIAFPLANQARARLAAGYSRPVGETLGLNTLGSIAGSLSAGFLLIPLMGIQQGMLFSSSFYLAWGILVLGAVLYTYRPTLRPIVAVGVALGMIASFSIPYFTPVWSAEVLGSFSNNQLFLYVGKDGEVRAGTDDFKGEVSYYKEGRGASVAVIEQSGYHSLAINGKVVATDDRSDLRTEYMLGHVPVLMHPNPKTALVVGMGAGVTLGSVVAHDDLDQIALAEIEPAVLGAAPQFARANGNPLQDPRLDVYLEDGRNFLKTTNRTFDVITADPIHPWTRGSGYLYTEEYYRVAASRLNPGGVMCQWLPLPDLSPEDFKSVVATFAKVFPYTMLFHSTAAVLIGSMEPFDVDIENLTTRLAQPRVNQGLSTVGLSQPLIFMSELALDDGGVRQFSDGAIINTDDNLHLEFSSPLAVGENTYTKSIVDEMYEIGPGESPLANNEEFEASLRELQALKSATIEIDRSFKTHPPGAAGPAETRLRTIVREHPDYEPARFLLSDHLMLRSDLLFRSGQPRVAATTAREAVILMPSNGEARLILGMALIQLGKLDAAISELRQAQEDLPRHWMIPYRLSEALMRNGQPDDSLAALRVAAEIHPSNVEIQNRLQTMESRLSNP